MSPEFLLELSRLPLFPRTAVDLIRVVGREGAARLISAWGGQSWPVPMRIGGGNPAGQIRYAELCELVGEVAAERIVRHYGGGDLDVPNLKEVIGSYRQDEIRAEFDRLTTRHGYSARQAVFELGIKWGITGKAVQNALKRPNNVKAEVVQMGLF